MRHRILREAQEALTNALRGLEDIRTIRPDDPALSELKAQIRRTIGQAEPDDEFAAA